MANQTEIKTKLIESPIKFLQDTKLEPVRHTEKTANLQENVKFELRIKQEKSRTRGYKTPVLVKGTVVTK